MASGEAVYQPESCAGKPPCSSLLGAGKASAPWGGGLPRGSWAPEWGASPYSTPHSPPPRLARDSLGWRDSHPSPPPTHAPGPVSQREPGRNKGPVCPGQRRKVPPALSLPKPQCSLLGLPPWKPPPTLTNCPRGCLGCWDVSHRQDNRAGAHAGLCPRSAIPVSLPPARQFPSRPRVKNRAGAQEGESGGPGSQGTACCRDCAGALAWRLSESGPWTFYPQDRRLQGALSLCVLGHLPGVWPGLVQQTCPSPVEPAPEEGLLQGQTPICSFSGETEAQEQRNLPHGSRPATTLAYSKPCPWQPTNQPPLGPHLGLPPGGLCPSSPPSCASPGPSSPACGAAVGSFQGLPAFLFPAHWTPVP